MMIHTNFFYVLLFYGGLLSIYKSAQRHKRAGSEWFPELFDLSRALGISEGALTRSEQYALSLFDAADRFRIVYILPASSACIFIWHIGHAVPLDLWCAVFASLLFLYCERERLWSCASRAVVAEVYGRLTPSLADNAAACAQSLLVCTQVPVPEQADQIDLIYEALNTGIPRMFSQSVDTQALWLHAVLPVLTWISSDCADTAVEMMRNILRFSGEPSEDPQVVEQFAAHVSRFGLRGSARTVLSSIILNHDPELRRASSEPMVSQLYRRSIQELWRSFPQSMRPALRCHMRREIMSEFGSVGNMNTDAQVIEILSHLPQRQMMYFVCQAVLNTWVQKIYTDSPEGMKSWLLDRAKISLVGQRFDVNREDTVAAIQAVRSNDFNVSHLLDLSISACRQAVTAYQDHVKSTFRHNMIVGVGAVLMSTLCVLALCLSWGVITLPALGLLRASLACFVGIFSVAQYAMKPLYLGAAESPRSAESFWSFIPFVSKPHLKEEEPTFSLSPNLRGS